MKLFKIQINKDLLKEIPEEELLFFIQLTNFANEIFSLQKITFFSASVEEEDSLIRRAKNSQALFMIRLTAGKLWEGWRLLETYFFNSILSKDYFDQFSDEAKDNLNFLKNYFSKSNLIKTIRDEYAFHYSSESSQKIKEVIDKLGDQDELALFLSEHHGNCFYDMSDALINESLFSSIDGSNRKDAIKKILTEVVRVTQNYLHFVGECVLVFGKKYLGMDSEEIEIPDQPSLDEVRIPYFVSEVPPADLESAL